MGNLHQTPLVIFCYIAPAQWTLSEVLVNQATGQGKWWGNLLKHQHWRLLWNMWISFQIEAIKWVLLLFDLPSAKVERTHSCSPCWGMYPFPIWFGLMKGAHNENPKTWLYVCTNHRFCPFLRNYHGFWPQLKKPSVLCYFPESFQIETMLFI